MQVFVTVVKMLLIVAVIVVGLFPAAAISRISAARFPPLGGIAGFFAAMVSALWAYDGWNNVSMVSSEIRNPQRNLPALADSRHARGHRHISADQRRLFLCSQPARWLAATASPPT